MEQVMVYEAVKHFVVYTVFFILIIFECSMIGYTLSEAVCFVVRKIRKRFGKKKKEEDSHE